MTTHPVLIDGQWRPSTGKKFFHAVNPKTMEALPDQYPISPWSEIEEVLQAASRAADIVRHWPGSRFAEFLETYATMIEERAESLVAIAHLETGLAVQPRLKDVELPRTTNQLRQAAKAARDGSWAEPTIDTATNIRSILAPIGPVAVFGPNNFPYAYNGVVGGDFASAVAAGNPVIGKGHSLHPETTRLFAEIALKAAVATKMPNGFVQLIYRTSHDDGEKFVSHPLLGAVGYTGSRSAGTVLKTAADRVGKPIYLELSSINPVYLLPGALAERGAALAEQFSTSCLMGMGQFCTNPGLILMLAGPNTEEFIRLTVERFRAAPVGTLLGESVQKNLHDGIKTLVAHGATLLTGGSTGGGAGYSCQNTLLRVTGKQFIKSPEALQTEAFGNSSLVVVCESAEELLAATHGLEGNLTGSLYTAESGADDALYALIEPVVRQKVGRLLNDKMPTGVAVVASMNHGGPFPATGHPGFTAVGFPSSVRRFGMLQCYDNVRMARLPAALQDKNPTGSTWRRIDGNLTQSDVPAKT
ncbi:aldehyde dehydrogenase (NADP(+)) [Schlesneria paludicola]|uniref:aldehyde dehydrogenase (NADP(+)) n=1 Tax=Schlesneria paludicola TaxID=360056 RepID=UPI000299EA08|nr:aldehyde dehydrogenase family protein [Schlesneria paludicola]